MYLDKYLEKMLNGEYGWVKAKALQIIVKVGEALGAEKLIPVKHVHVSGISYLNIGEPGLKLLEELAEKGGRAEVYTTVNPSCIDLLGETRVIDQSMYKQQLLINKALEKMGFNPTYTCIPYLHRLPAPREHLAWGESNAVIMANSFYGAYTNREGGPLALAAALTGYTYYAGLHKLENRDVKYIVKLRNELHSEKEYSLLGLWIGESFNDIPLLVFQNKPFFHELKLLLASSAASGSHGLIVLNGITPKGTYIIDKAERTSIDIVEIKKNLDKYLGEPHGSILGYIGCPHLHPYELYMLYRIVSNYKRVKDQHALLVSIPYTYKNYFDKEVALLKSKGIDVVYGTCPIVSKLRRKYDTVLTNSGKAAFYMSRLHKLDVVLASLKEIIDRVMEK